MTPIRDETGHAPRDASAHTQTASHSPDVAHRGELVVDHVFHDYLAGGRRTDVLNDVSFRIPAGSVACVVGPSGCGKSTLLGLAAGLLRPSKGTLRWDGAPVKMGPTSHLGMAFQQPGLFPWMTVRQNVAIGLRTRGHSRRDAQATADRFLDTVGLADFKDAYPGQLSGGMAQRASLARALVNDPTLLILDEPLGKLDSLTRLAMQGELTRLWQRRGFTVLMVTHDVEEALLLSNRVIVFSDRPARLSADLAVDLPYPRHRDHPELLRLRREALGLLGMGGDW